LTLLEIILECDIIIPDVIAQLRIVERCEPTLIEIFATKFLTALPQHIQLVDLWITGAHHHFTPKDTLLVFIKNINEIRQRS
jgi:hypothetical protein